MMLWAWLFLACIPAAFALTSLSYALGRRMDAWAARRVDRMVTEGLAATRRGGGR